MGARGGRPATGREGAEPRRSGGGEWEGAARGHVGRAGQWAGGRRCHGGRGAIAAAAARGGNRRDAGQRERRVGARGGPAPLLAIGQPGRRGRGRGGGGGGGAGGHVPRLPAANQRGGQSAPARGEVRGLRGGHANPHGPRGEEVREVSVQLPAGVQGKRPAHRLPPRILQTRHLAVPAAARRPRPRGAPCGSARGLRPLRGPLPVGGAPGALAGALSPLPEGLGHWRAVPAGAVPALPPPRAPIGRGGCWAGGGHVGPRPALPANPRGVGGAGGGRGGVSAARGLLGLRAGQPAPPPPRLTPPAPGGHLGPALPGRSAPFGGHFRLDWATEGGTSGAHGGPHRKALPVQSVLSDSDFRSGSHLGSHAPPPTLSGHLGLAPPPLSQHAPPPAWPHPPLYRSPAPL